jgi:hypothetical protein
LGPGMKYVGLVSGREMGVGHALVLETIFSVLPGPSRLLTLGNWNNTTRTQICEVWILRGCGSECLRRLNTGWIDGSGNSRKCRVRVLSFGRRTRLQPYEEATTVSEPQTLRQDRYTAPSLKADGRSMDTCRSHCGLRVNLTFGLQ